MIKESKFIFFLVLALMPFASYAQWHNESKINNSTAIQIKNEIEKYFNNIKLAKNMDQADREIAECTLLIAGWSQEDIDKLLIIDPQALLNDPSQIEEIVCSYDELFITIQAKLSNGTFLQAICLNGEELTRKIACIHLLPSRYLGKGKTFKETILFLTPGLFDVLEEIYIDRLVKEENL